MNLIQNDYLIRILRSPVQVTEVGQLTCEPGHSIPEGVINTSRLILIISGSLEYTIEGNSFVLGECVQFLVPAWVRRRWSVSGDRPCAFMWCAFDDDPQEISTEHCFLRRLSASSLKRQKAAHTELLRMWTRLEQATPDAIETRSLEMEGFIKNMLAQFWIRVEETASIRISRKARLHPEVTAAIRWLNLNFRDPDVLNRLQLVCGLTPNYFRKQFREIMDCSPGAYVQRLRMRHARHLLNTTVMQVKRVAAEVGYTDPLYFSRLYQKFWHQSPSSEGAPRQGKSVSGK